MTRRVVDARRARRRAKRGDTQGAAPDKHAGTRRPRGRRRAWRRAAAAGGGAASGASCGWRRGGAHTRRWALAASPDTMAPGGGKWPREGAGGVWVGADRRERGIRAEAGPIDDLYLSASERCICRRIVWTANAIVFDAERGRRPGARMTILHTWPCRRRRAAHPPSRSWSPAPVAMSAGWNAGTARAEAQPHRPSTLAAFLPCPRHAPSPSFPAVMAPAPLPAARPGRPRRPSRWTAGGGGGNRQWRDRPPPSHRPFAVSQWR